MDLITSAILAAIARGAPARLPAPLAERCKLLKTALSSLPGGASILDLIATLETMPAGQDHALRLKLAQALSEAHAPDDMATLFAAQGLLDQLDRLPLAQLDQTASAPEHAVVRTYFATDRRRELGQPPALRFSGARSGDAAGAVISYGVCDIAVPRDAPSDVPCDHCMGQLEAPSPWRENPDHPDHHPVLLTAEVLQRTQFFASLAATMAGATQRSALLFVPGYHLTFEDAARRTAQLAYELGFDGAPVFYSWPSQGTPADPAADANNIEWSTPHLTAFLADFLQKTDAAKVYLIGHSMGKHGMTRALAELAATHPALMPKITAISLSAPDIDAAVFKHDIAPRLAGARPCPVSST